MKHLLLSAGILLGTVSSWGGPCPGWPIGTPAYTYYLQNAMEVVRKGLGSNWASTPVIRNLRSDLSDIGTVKFSLRTRYMIPLVFTPNCTQTGTPAATTFWFKDSTPGAQTFSRKDSSYHRIIFYDSLDPKLSSHPEYIQWMSFNPIDTSGTVYGYLGRVNTPGAPFENWMGVAYLEDSVQVSASTWQTSIYSYPTLTGPYDSAALDNALVLRNNWHTKTVDPGHRPMIYAHTLRLRYDTIAPSPLRKNHSKQAMSFSAWQQGTSVWIQVSDVAATGETVELHDMFGRKTAELKPSGSAYVWDGKSLQGSDAPAGIYFVRSKAGILGRFAFSR